MLLIIFNGINFPIESIHFLTVDNLLMNDKTHETFHASRKTFRSQSAVRIL